MKQSAFIFCLLSFISCYYPSKNSSEINVKLDGELSALKIIHLKIHIEPKDTPFGLYYLVVEKPIDSDLSKDYIMKTSCDELLFLPDREGQYSLYFLANVRSSYCAEHLKVSIGPCDVGIADTYSYGSDLVAIEYNERPYSIRSTPFNIDSYSELDSEGVPVHYWRGKRYYNPTTIAAAGLYLIANHHSGIGSEGDLDKAIEFAEKLVELSEQVDDAIFLPYNFGFWMVDYLTPPWVSGMAQGRALHFFTRLYLHTLDERWIEYGSKLLNSYFALRSRHEKYWVTTIEDNYLWIEEYPQYWCSHVLNGFIFALYGIYEYWVVTKDQNAYLLLDRSVKTLKRYIQEYRQPKDVSLYCLKRDRGNNPITAGKYHEIHINQLRWLFRITNDQYFESVSDQFGSDY
jgi:hypothetical protein